MFSRVCLFLIGAVFIHYQVNAEECLLIGEESSCNCSAGLVWSNEVCYSSGCCNETTCTGNVSRITPLCPSKSKVYMNGSVTVTSTVVNCGRTIQSQLVNVFRKLNGLEFLNITVCSRTKAEFEAVVSMTLKTSKLQEVVTEVETTLSAEVRVDTVGMVKIRSPNASVCYMSSPELMCTLEEATHGADWYMNREHERFVLKDGHVVNVNHSCATEDDKSCVAVLLQNVTGAFSGTYECGFTIGSIRHTAKAQLIVALLPDEIIMTGDPLTGDCSGVSQNVFVRVTATIAQSTESYEVSWTPQVVELEDSSTTTIEDSLVYSVKAKVMCQKAAEAQSVSIVFKNTKGQQKSAHLDIPVIYEGSPFCSADETDVFWPNTPDGSTLINTCGPGRHGYRSRTCEGNTWQPVFSNCISLKMKMVQTAAENFLNGLGATNETGVDVFEQLKNSFLSSDLDDSLAEIRASIRVFDVMSVATKKNVLTDTIIPNFFTVASKMVNNSWQQENSSIISHMSSNYLRSVEDLVKNIKINSSRESYEYPNLDLKISPTSKNVSMFGVNVILNATTGLMKAVAVKNLIGKLKNNFSNTEPLNDLVIIATLENSNASSLEITTNFPNERPSPAKKFCVFWDTTLGDWSDSGCTVEQSTGKRVICKCTHLTSFSVLISRSNSPDHVLDMITYVGLGVSILSLLILLIVESLVWSVVVKTSLSHFRHTALVNIAVFLLLADCSFLASCNPHLISPTWCLILTICKHLFFLAMFSWMFCLSVLLIHQLIFVFSPLRKRVFMLLSSIVGYACPVLIVGSSYVYCKYTNKPYHNDKCWLVFDGLLKGSLHTFLLPVGTVIFTNVFSMAVVIFTLLRTSLQVSITANKKATVKSIIKVVLCLTPVFGVTWGIGFFQLLLGEDHPLHNVARYSFTILNSFQGLFVMLTGCFSEPKVRETLLKLMVKGNNNTTTHFKHISKR